MIPNDKRREVIDFLKKPTTLVVGGVGVACALALYVMMSPGLGNNSYRRVGYDSPEDTGIVKSARSMTARHMSSLFTFGKVAAPEPGGAAPLEAISGKGAAGQSLVGDAAKAVAGIPGAFEGALGEVQGGPDSPAAAQGAANAGRPDAAAVPAASGGGLGSFGSKSTPGSSGGGGGGAMMDPNAHAGLQGGSAGAAGRAAVAPAGRAVAPVVSRRGAAVDVRGPSSLASARNQAFGAPGAFGSGARFGAGTSGAPVSTTGAGEAGVQGGGTPASIGAQNPGANTGGTGAGNSTAMNPEGGGGGGGGGDGGGRMGALATAAGSFNSQPALTTARKYLMCLIKTYEERYSRAQSALGSMVSTVGNAQIALAKYPGPYAKLHELYLDLTDSTQWGFKVEFDNAVKNLEAGKKCLGQALSQDDTAKCYQQIAGPLRAMKKPLGDELNGLYNLVGQEGQEAMDAFIREGDQYKYWDEYDYPNRHYYPRWGPWNGALGYLNDTIAASQSQIKVAQDAILGMYDWGDRQNVQKVKEAFLVQYGMASTRIADVQPTDVPRAQQGEFQKAQTAAELNLASANEEWNQYDPGGDKFDEIGHFVEAERLTKFAAMSIASVANAGKLQAANGGMDPSAQLGSIEDEPLHGQAGSGACDVDAPPPSDDKK
ncbi:MAG: hypothetical protein NTX64_04895 [Elusimicrobia bacterium]|nr:hypothetical protein [Elusimicrobiota bacterium]